jgi:hypothetical protein
MLLWTLIMHISVQVFDFNCFGHMPRSRIAEWKCHSMLNFFWWYWDLNSWPCTCQAAMLNFLGADILFSTVAARFLDSYQQHTKILISPHSCQYLLFSGIFVVLFVHLVFWDNVIAILIGKKWYLMVVLIYISLIVWHINPLTLHYFVLIGYLLYLICWVFFI